MTVRFDEAWLAAQTVAADVAAAGLDVVVVRDLLGRISLLLDDRKRNVDEERVGRWGDGLAQAAGPFAAPARVTLASAMLQPDVYFEAGDRLVKQQRDDRRGTLALLERQVAGAEWTRLDEHPDNSRVTLYGFKGGVGRSTATFMLAQHLAALGRCVLVVDLDLESPGVGALLQPDDQLPEYGLVDHLVEAAVGNAGGLDLVSRSRLVEVSGNGEVWLAPAGGRPRAGYDYLAKLNRVYMDLPPGRGPASPGTLGGRLRAAVGTCEDRVAEFINRKPDVTLIDSRAGIHDIAAVALTQLSDLCFLFAIDSQPTWWGYRTLFGQWNLDAGLARDIRRRLRMVAPFVPSSLEKEYLRRFRDRAQACFADTLYDSISASTDADAFNPAPDDEDAPHSPLPILFSSDLVGLDVGTRPEWSRNELVIAAYRAFVEGAALLITGDEP